MNFFKAGKNVFADEEFFLQAIHSGDSRAIVYLQDKATGFTKSLLQQKQLPQHLLGEVLNEGSIIFIKKIRTPGFALHSAKVSTYFLEIIKNVVSNKTRGRQYAAQETLENVVELSDHSVLEYYSRKENMELVAKLLNQIGLPCSNIITLKYLDGYSDEEVVQGKLSPYTSVESLRVKRSDCMKKIKEQALHWKSDQL